jgi:hypothetical protein
MIGSREQAIPPEPHGRSEGRIDGQVLPARAKSPQELWCKNSTRPRELHPSPMDPDLQLTTSHLAHFVPQIIREFFIVC